MSATHQEDDFEPLDSFATLQRAEIKPPTGFEAEEWAKLTGGFESETYEIVTILAERGAAGSRKGRPTNYNASYNRPLSATPRAVAQRNRKATQDEEAKAISKAGDGDRSARRYLLGKIKEHKKDGDEVYVARMMEQLEEKRFRENKSAEWLQTKLDEAHRKWDRIYYEVDCRDLDMDMSKRPAAPEIASPPQKLLGAERLWASGGLVEKLMRKQYQEGLAMNRDNSWLSKRDRAEWVAFCKGLTDAKLAIVRAPQFKEYEYQFAETLIDPKDKDKPFHPPKNDNECEVEISEDEDEDDKEDDDYDLGTDEEGLEGSVSDS